MKFARRMMENDKRGLDDSLVSKPRRTRGYQGKKEHRAEQEDAHKSHKKRDEKRGISRYFDVDDEE